MSGAGKDDERPKLERFDGTVPSMYRRWKRKAQLMLLALPTTYTKDRWGAKLMEYVAGEAEEVCETLPLDKLVKEGGHELVFQALDAKYQELQKDALHKHLTELKEHAVELPEEVGGWFLLRKLQLDQTSEAMVLTHTKGSLAYKEVTAAVTAIFPQGVSKTGGGKSREVFEAIAEEEVVVGNDGEDGEDVFQAVAAQIQAQDEYDDEDAIEVYETYQDIRRKMQQKKMGRGYKQQPSTAPSRWTLTWTVRGKVEQLKAKSRCHLCQEFGHWKRECPKKKGSASSGAKPSRSNDAMVTDQGGNSGLSELGQELFFNEEDIDQLEIYLAEKDGRVDVVLADPREHGAGEDDDVRGDLEAKIFDFFQKVQDQPATEEAYMADLATHGVPDTACRRTLIGESVLGRMSEALGRAGLKVQVVKEEHEFKFGNAGVIRTEKSAIIPVRIGEKQLAIKAAVLPGSGSGTPLLLSKELLRGLKATLDMENDVLVVRRCGVQMKLRETERGQYAIPLFEGLGVMNEPDVTQKMQVKTHEVMSYLPEDINMGAPVETFTRTPLIDSLLQEVGPQLEIGQHELPAATLDQMSDKEEDAPDGLVHGLSGRTIFNIGKYMKTGRAVSFEIAYQTDKAYVAWVRKFTGKTTHPTMAQFRLYVALRDQRKSERVSRETLPVPPTAAAKARGAQTKAKAKARPQLPASSSQPQPEPEEWILATHAEEMAAPTPAQKAEAFAPDRDDDARVGTPGRRGEPGLSDDEGCDPQCMSKGEKQLCRRGVQSCNIPVEREYEGPSGVDVLYLEPGVELSIATAAGLTSDHIFSEGELSAKVMGRAETLQSALEKVRSCKPVLLVVRTPEHMTKSRGGVGLCRTYNTKQRCDFTRLVAACCAEQLCDGRQFCVFMENESMKKGVKAWARVLSDVGSKVVRLGDSCVDEACVYTNSKQVQDRLTMGWPHVQRRDDERWFGKDVAVAVMEKKRARHEVMAAHCVYMIDDLRADGAESERKVLSVLRKCHENLGHPSTARFVMLLKSAHASERVIKLAKGLECETCSEMSKPKAHRVAKMRKATEFNQQVCVDTFELDVRYSKIHFLNIVDEATGFQLCTPLWKGMQAKHVRNAYRKTWKRWAGAPIRLFCDGGKECEGEFEHGLSLDGTYGDVSAAYAPWQNAWAG
ncbi:unnamed protein product [Symbiodinium sp. CCMP2456]|nr:unnamed protein product [Symbiodinium sp. CCMP2456]